MLDIKLTGTQNDMRDITVNGVYFGTAIKVDGGVTLDHLQPDDGTIFDITKSNGQPVKTWTDTVKYIAEYVENNNK